MNNTQLRHIEDAERSVSWCLIAGDDMSELEEEQLREVRDTLQKLMYEELSG